MKNVTETKPKLTPTEVRDAINKRLSNDVIQLASDVPPVPRVTTGLLSLDEATGGGLPLGVPISIQGHKSVGKSAFSYYMAGRAIKQYGGVMFLLQAEKGFDYLWAEACGLPAKGCLFFEADRLDIALDLVLDIIKKDQPRCVLIDSLSMLDRDPDHPVGDTESRGARAIPSNRFFRKLMGSLSTETPPLFLYIEHLHPNISSPTGGLMVTGGVTKGYANVMEIRLSVESTVKQTIETDHSKQELPVQARVQWDIRKSKASPQGGKGIYTIGLRETPLGPAGEISDFDEMLARAIMLGHVEKAGSWYTIGEDKFQGAAGIKEKLGIEAVREIALRPRATGGETDGQGDGNETPAAKRSGPAKGGPGKGVKIDPRARPVSRGAKGNKQKADSAEAAVAGEDHEGSTG